LCGLEGRPRNKSHTKGAHPENRKRNVIRGRRKERIFVSNLTEKLIVNAED